MSKAFPRAPQPEYDLIGVLIDIQERRCGICGGDGKGPTHKGVLVLDHDHSTGRARGVLCGGCNLGLGQIGDTLEAAMAAVNYLLGAEKRREMAMSERAA